VRRPLLSLTVIALAAASPAAGLAQSSSPAPEANGPAQNIVADNDHGATVLALSGLAVSRASAQNASPTNLARANAHDCASPCQAIAAAFQIVLVPAGATTQAPQNVALATNVNCDHCGSFAYAYQYVVDVPRGVKLSGHANQQIKQLRQQADQDVHAGLDYPTLDAHLHDLATQFRATVDADLTQQHQHEDHKQSFQTVKQNPAD
jgi:hypothetical protein